MTYNPNTELYHIHKGKKYTEHTREEIAGRYDRHYLDVIKTMERVGLKAGGGAPGDGKVGRKFQTKVTVLKPAKEQWLCFGYSTGNLFRYLHYEEFAQELFKYSFAWSNAPVIGAINEFERLLRIYIPHISQPVSYGQYRRGKKTLNITLEEVLGNRDPYPWLIMPTTKDGVFAHVFWAIHDIIFDTISNKALKRLPETIYQIYGTLELNIQAKHYRYPDPNKNNRAHHAPYPQQLVQHFDPDTKINYEEAKQDNGGHTQSQRKKKRQKLQIKLQEEEIEQK